MSGLRPTGLPHLALSQFLRPPPSRPSTFHFETSASVKLAPLTTALCRSVSLFIPPLCLFSIFLSLFTQETSVVVNSRLKSRSSSWRDERHRARHSGGLPLVGRNRFGAAGHPRGLIRPNLRGTQLFRVKRARGMRVPIITATQPARRVAARRKCSLIDDPGAATRVAIIALLRADFATR